MRTKITYIYLRTIFTFIFVFLDSVNSTVENTKHAAQTAVDTAKTYVDSAKGIFLFFLFCVCVFFVCD